MITFESRHGSATGRPKYSSNTSTETVRKNVSLLLKEQYCSSTIKSGQNENQRQCKQFTSVH